MTKITAEFESVDLAERAARTICNKFEEIDQVKILVRKSRERANLNRLVLPYSSVNGVGNIAYNYDGVYYEPAQRQQAYVAIVAENDASKIKGHLLNLGGIKVKSEIVS